MTEALLVLDGVTKAFRLRGRRRVTAVDAVSLSVERGETVGLVGESGCGKSTLARCIVGLHGIDAGGVRFAGVDLASVGRRAMPQVHRDLVMVFQDPFASLNPRRRVGDIIAAPLDIHRVCRGAERRRRIIEMLERVGLSESHINRYPHEFSGGQRQRIGLARALITSPQLVICDEPVSALDVSVQAQILNLLSDLQTDLGLTVLFIAHNLGVVRHSAERMAVMYRGRIVEEGPAEAVFDRPRHPYTAGLLAAVPVPDPAARIPGQVLGGDVPSTTTAISGCHFHPRCSFATDRCRAEAPDLGEAVDGRRVACHRADEITLVGARDSV